MTDLVPMLTGTRRSAPGEAWTIHRADASQLAHYRALRRDAFVDEQGLFVGTDHDDNDDDPRTIVLVATAADGTVIGGVRLGPRAGQADLGWWTGGRLVVAPAARGAGGIGAALVRAACATALEHGVLRFDATVQERVAPMFDTLGWVRWGRTQIGGVLHVRMRWPIDRIAALAASTKSFLGSLLEGGPAGESGNEFHLSGAGFVGDDGALVPGTDVIAATDGILPLLIDRDPEWAGWCAVLVNLNDLSAMGATPLGLMNSLGARDASFARRIMNGLRSGSEAWGVPMLGGHSQVGVSSALSVTALGRTAHPVPGGGAQPGHALSVSADLGGHWRRGFEGRQWDSSSSRSGDELRHLASMVGAARPSAAKDVSMTGVVGTVGMMAEASGCRATIDVERLPHPSAAASAFGDWVTCFPGFSMVTADDPGRSRMGSPITTTRECGQFSPGDGVGLRWPDGEITEAVPAEVTGLGPA